MRRRTVLALSGTALLSTLPGCGARTGATGAGPDTPADTPVPTPTETETETKTETTAKTRTTTEEPDGPADLVNGSFEDDWTGWSVGRDLPADPNRERGRDVASSAGVTTTAAADGTTSLRLAIDGSQDDGTVWVQQPVDLSGSSHLAVDYLVSRSFNTTRKAAVYAGPAPVEPLTEADFDTSRALEGHRTSGWKTFRYEVTHDGPGLVAVGISVVWETNVLALLDDVRLSGTPATATTTRTTTVAEDAGRER